MGKRAWAGVVVFVILLIVGTGCISSGMKDEKVLRKYSEEAVALETRSAGDIVASLQGKIQKAYDDELNIYAPKHLVAAENALDQAGIYQSGADTVKAMQEAIFAEKIIASAYVVKQNVKRVLKRVFHKQARLVSLGVPVLMADQYESLKKKIKGAVEAVEDGSMDSAMKDEATLLEEMVRLEVLVIKQIALKKAEEALELATDEGAKKMAPKSLQQATDAIEKVRVFIEGNPQADAEARVKGEAAHRTALHALYITREATAISILGKKDLWEEIALEFEGHLSRMSYVVGAGSVNHMSLMDQANMISAHVQKERAAALETLATQPVKVEPVVAVTPTLDVPVSESSVVSDVNDMNADVPSVDVADPVEAMVSKPEELADIPVADADLTTPSDGEEESPAELSGSVDAGVTESASLETANADDPVKSDAAATPEADIESIEPSGHKAADDDIVTVTESPSDATEVTTLDKEVTDETVESASADVLPVASDTVTAVKKVSE